jgi:hypothetical protein
MTESAIRLKVDRDSVCAGDDGVSHAVSVLVAPESTFVEVLKAAQKACPLAGISGGNATWLIDTEGYGKGCVGVIAQQWKEPKLLISPNTAAVDIWGNAEGSLNFRYWGQASPDAVFEAVKTGSGLPSRYS